METILQRNKDIDGVIAGNDTMALGAVAALKAAKLIDKVKVVGFDGCPDAVDAVKKGEMAATVLQPAAQIAEMAVEQADQMIKTGKTGQPEKQSIDCELVTKDNADEFGVFVHRPIGMRGGHRPRSSWSAGGRLQDPGRSRVLGWPAILI